MKESLPASLFFPAQSRKGTEFLWHHSYIGFTVHSWANVRSSLFFYFAKRTKSIRGILSHGHDLRHSHPLTRKFRISCYNVNPTFTQKTEQEGGSIIRFSL